MGTPSVSIVLRPTHDREQTRLAERDLHSFFQSAGDDVEILLTRQPSEIHSQLQKARGEFIVLTDSSLSVPLAEILAMLAQFQREKEIHVIIGDRLLARKNRFIYHGWQKWIQKVLHHRFKLVDPFCPLLVIRQSALRTILPELRESDVMLLLDIILCAHEKNFTVYALPVQTVQKPARLSFVKSLMGSLRLLWHHRFLN